MLLANFLHNTLVGFFLFIDGVIYNFITYFYDIFLFLSKLNLFAENDYSYIIRNIYIVLGVVMLFALSYSLLKAIVNPDEFAKGQNSFPNLIKKIMWSLVIVAFLPLAFTLAGYIQSAIVDKNVIGNIVLPDGVKVDSDNQGAEIAMNVFDAFFYPTEPGTNPSRYTGIGKNAKYETIRDDVRETGGSFLQFEQLRQLVGKDDESEITYNFPFSTIAGAFMLWTLLLFCFDLAIRMVKLAFYQIIAPVAAVCRAMPNNNISKIWENWLKVTLATYLEVFIRVAVMYIGVYFIILVSNSFGDNPTIKDLPNYPNLGILVKAFVIMGIFAFVRQAPKLISDVFGFDSSNLNLGIKGLRQRLSDGGGYLMGAGIVGSQAGVRNLVSSFANKKNWTNPQGKVTAGSIAKNLTRGFGSGISGAVGGAVRGASAGFNAKSFKDTKAGAKEAITKTTAARDKRWRYTAEHGGGLRAAGSRITDVGKSIATFYGFNNPEEVQRELDGINEVQRTRDALTDGITQMLETNASKGKNYSYGLSDFQTAELRKYDKKIKEYEFAGNFEEAEKTRDARAKYLKKAATAIAENAMKSDKEYRKLFDSLATQDERVAFEQFRVNADSYKAALGRNLETEFVKTANKRAIEVKALESINGSGAIHRSEIERQIIDHLYNQHLRIELDIDRQEASLKTSLATGIISSSEYKQRMSELNQSLKRAMNDIDRKNRFAASNRATIDVAVNTEFNRFIDKTTHKYEGNADWIENLTDEQREEIIERNKTAYDAKTKEEEFRTFVKEELVTYETLQEGLRMGDESASKHMGPVMDALKARDERVLNSMKQEEKSKEGK